VRRSLLEQWVYMNEEEVGKAITDSLADGTVSSRDELWVTSKLWNNFHRPELVRSGCVESLTKLGLEHLDLFLMHFPVSFKPGVAEAVSADQMEDPPIPLADTWRAMEALVDEGLVRNIGVSNFEIDHLEQIQRVATKPIAVNQFETHPYYQRGELLRYCAEHGIVVTAHSSMGGANNAMTAFHSSPPLRDDATIGAIAKKHGQTPSAVLLRWALQRPTAIIPKSVTRSRIAENLAVAGSFELDADDMAEIATLDKPGLEGCYCHPKTPWLGRSEFQGSTDHYYG
jgi:diketogulonate reductase-like aldo/keto reductase